MIVRSRCQDACFFEPHFLDELEITLNSPYPACNLRILITLLKAFSDGFFIFLTVEEEFALTDKSVRSSQFVQEVVQVNNLLNRIRWACLLAISKGCVGNPYLIGRIHWIQSII